MPEKLIPVINFKNLEIQMLSAFSNLNKDQNYVGSSNLVEL